MEISPGEYITRDGSHAYVWGIKRDKDGDYWEGTVKDSGYCTWDMDGKDENGTTEYDLVKKEV